ncbi:O-antigen ligase family protein [Rhodovulum steppense]|uniref:O-antigen ligase-like membrane protein n=1 Tax=Rhodovulum steppense TaxID=540251 RepID=A0A4R1YMR8_9RHOB|nr:O-antigen ligase family protein [Rhodovulum steppense]TCM78972.1 O-antigen ligase-like membrane protein [Rhodovulum steppense]
MPPLVALFAWPVVVAILFQRLRLPLAILVAIVAGYLLLPSSTEIDLPLLPALNKHTVPVLSVLLMIVLVAARDRTAHHVPGLLPRHPLARLFLLLVAVGAFLTVITNGETLVYGPTVIPGLRPYDGFSEVLTAIMLILPLLVARKYLADPASHRLLLLVLCIAGLAYSLLALFEVRMSPQLNRWVYGFFPHSWAQHFRGGGFRPVVFLGHGLWLAIFFSATVLATLGLARVDPKRRGLFLAAAVWLLLTLVLCKSLGALAITLALIPFAFFLGIRGQLLVAAIIAGLFLTYPMVRASNLVPLDRIMDAAASIDEQRASSLQTRLVNEDRLLAKAQERPLFGWGGWSRWRVFNEDGVDITISDGAWIIEIGARGWMGYAGKFGLLTVPILLLFLGRRRSGVGMETSVLALIMAGNLMDMIPNGTMTVLTWLFAGALWGRLEWQGQEVAQTEREPASALRSAYRRPVSEPTAALAEMPTIPSAHETVYTRQTQRVYRQKRSPR